MACTARLRWINKWLLIGWLLVFAVVILSLIPPVSADIIPLFLLTYKDKIAHFIAYFVLMGWFVQIYHDHSQRIYFAFGFLLLGITIEILQGLGGIRESDWRDVVANSSGIIFAYLLSKTSFANMLIWIEKKLIR